MGAQHARSGEPVVITRDGRPVGSISAGDSVIFFNFRSDRARQLTRALTQEDFGRFPRPERPDLRFACMTPQQPTLPRVPTYDLQPEMSAYEGAERAVAEVGSGRHDVLILNFANGDMVGHSGILPAAIRAIEAGGENLRRVAET